MYSFLHTSNRIGLIMDKVRIGKTIRKFRRRYDLTQKDLAKIIKTPRTRISKWERGFSTPVGYKLIEIMAILQITVGDFYDGDNGE